MLTSIANLKYNVYNKAMFSCIFQQWQFLMDQNGEILVM